MPLYPQPAMLVVVIPLKSAQVARSWQQVCKLLERSLRSVCNQTSSRFSVVVVCHEKPQLSFEHAQIHYLSVDFAPPIASDADKQQLNHQRTDKGRKQLAGLIYAAALQPTHTLLMDADDCVSRRLAEFVAQHPTQNGWYMRQGYRYAEDSDRIRIKRRNFYRMCGTCNILRYDLNRLPTQPEYSRGYGYYRDYIDHAKAVDRLARQGTPIAPLPFPGAVYITETGENLYYQSSRFRQGILPALNDRLLTPTLRREFGLYPLYPAPPLACSFLEPR